MPLDRAGAKDLISELLKEIALRSGEARTDNFTNLRAVDAKVRDVKMVLRQVGATSLVEEMEKDSDFVLKRVNQFLFGQDHSGQEGSTGVNRLDLISTL